MSELINKGSRLRCAEDLTSSCAAASSEVLSLNGEISPEEEKAVRMRVIALDGHSFQRFQARCKGRAGTCDVYHLWRLKASNTEVRCHAASYGIKRMICQFNIIIASFVAYPFTKPIKPLMANGCYHIAFCPNPMVWISFGYRFIQFNKAVIRANNIWFRCAKRYNRGKPISFTEPWANHNHRTPFGHFRRSKFSEVTLQDSACDRIISKSHPSNLHSCSPKAIAECL